MTCKNENRKMFKEWKTTKTRKYAKSINYIYLQDQALKRIDQPNHFFIAVSKIMPSNCYQKVCFVWGNIKNLIFFNDGSVQTSKSMKVCYQSNGCTVNKK